MSTDPQESSDFFYSEVFSLRSILPPYYNLGARSFNDLSQGATEQTDAGAGLLEAITQAAGECLNAVGGLRLTKLTQNVSPGDTVFHVLHCDGLPEPGCVAIDGIPYAYQTTSPGALVDVSYTHGGVAVPGAAAAHAIGACVTDLSRGYSAIGQVTDALFVDTATGQDLTVIGRNLGVFRLPNLEDDDQFRALIKALAYCPRGTMLALRLVLDTLVGAGNYSIFEDLVTLPCEVRVTVPGALFLNNVSQGKAYLQTPLTQAASSGALNTSAPQYFISSVRLPQDNFFCDTHAALPDACIVAPRPNASAQAVWTWAGQSKSTQDQGASIQPDIGGAKSTATDFQSAPGSFHYSGGIAPPSIVRAAGRFAFGLGGNISDTEARQFGVSIADGAKSIAWGVVQDGENAQLRLGLIDVSTGQFLNATSAIIQANQFYDIELRKLGTAAQMLVLGGVVVQTAPYGQAAVSTAFGVDVGALLGAALSCHAQVLSLGIKTVQPAEYLNLTQSTQVVASLPGAGSNQLVLAAGSAAQFLSQDTGKTVRISQSAVTNSLGGNNNGLYMASYADSRHINLQLPTGTAQLQSATPQRITLLGAPNVLSYPDSLGTKISLGPTPSGNAGVYQITKLLDPASFADLSGVPTAKSQPTNVCECAGASFVTEGAVDYQLLCQLTAESNVHFTLVDAASHSTNSDGTLNLAARTPLPLPQASYLLRGDNVKTAKVFDSHVPFVNFNVNGVASAQPFYVSDAFCFVEAYLKGVVAAGVRLNIFFS